MFAKWTVDKVKTRSNLKTALVTKIKAQAAKSMPHFPEIEDEIFPKKTPVIIHKLENHIEIYSINGIPQLVQLGDGTIFPYLKIAIEFPGLLRSVYCYDGAMLALFRGADLMARGTFGTDETFQVGEVVQIVLAEEEHPFGIGIMQMSGEEIAQRPDGAAVHVLHLLKDGLYEANGI